MKFLFLIYHEEKVLDTMPPKEMQKLVDSALDYDDEIRGSGHYIVSNALQRARTARTIRVRGGKATVTDGPFAETKEQLGGFFRAHLDDADPGGREARGHRARLVHVLGVYQEEASQLLLGLG